MRPDKNCKSASWLPQDEGDGGGRMRRLIVVNGEPVSPFSPVSLAKFGGGINDGATGDNLKFISPSSFAKNKNAR